MTPDRHRQADSQTGRPDWHRQASSQTGRPDQLM